ncbi:MAG TPA: hypothetical protein VKB80_14890 [Kofleriaceae bacterium]|nr:hypothetical protein [Kofleriaceae bacterium]
MARDRGDGEHGDERLLGRLRQLSLIDLDSLLAGSSGEGRADLLAAHADDVIDALGLARQRMAELTRDVVAGPDPLAILDAAPAVRMRGAAGEGPGRLAARLASRAEACRDLARMEEAAALLLPRLFEIERQRG